LQKIVLLYSGEADEASVENKIRASDLAPIMQPSAVKKIDEIPILGSGKVNFKAVKDIAAQLGL